MTSSGRRLSRRMSELFIYRGLPGSGKTTRARQMQRIAGGRLVGRDHIREMLFGLDNYEPSHGSERYVTEIQDKIIKDGLRAGEKVIVDDMNLRDKYVKRLMEIANNQGAPVSFIDLTNEPLDHCIVNDAFRSRTVGEEVIRDLHKRYIQGKGYPLPVPSLPEKATQPLKYTAPEGAPKAVIVDIDGTVAKMVDRSPFDESRVHEDLPNTPVIETVKALHQSGHRILFTSARTAGCKEATASWLSKYVGILDAQLFMRAEGDYRKDSIVKQEIFDNEIRYNYDVVCVLDDRDQVVKAWRDMGLTCLQVAPGDF